MNQEKLKPGAGRILAGILLGTLLAAASPILMMTEVMSLTVVLMLPSIGLVALNRWAGRGVATFAMMLQLLLGARMLGNTFMWMSFFMILVPVIVLLRCENRPFFEQMKISIAAFGGGVLLAVFTAYTTYGGNMVERALLELPKAVRELPQEYLGSVMQTYSSLFGNELTIEGFYTALERMMKTVIPVYQVNLPGLILAGALVTAVICTGMNGNLRNRQGVAVEGSYVPMREWALPGSTTGGLLLMLVVSYVMGELGMRQGDAVFYAVLDIAAAAFCIQALSSLARRLRAGNLKHGVRVAIVAVAAVLCLAGAALYVSVYGVASAVFGSRGMLRERMENRNRNNHSDGNE